MKLLYPRNLVERLYSGKNAERYEDNRSQSEKWKFEEESLILILSGLPSEQIKTLADIPVGTNRFAERLDAVEGVQRIYCVDFSVDMLAQAINRQRPKQVFLKHDLLEAPPKIFCNTAISFRFLNLFSFADVTKIMKNIADILEVNLILSIRIADQAYSHGDILERKIHIHGRNEFECLVSNLGFSIKKELHHPDEKGGRYYVMHLVKNA